MKKTNKRHFSSILYMIWLSIFALFLTLTVELFSDKKVASAFFCIMVTLLCLVPLKKFINYFKESGHKVLWSIAIGILGLISALIIITPDNNDNVDSSEKIISSIDDVDRKSIVNDELSSKAETTTAKTSTSTTTTSTSTTIETPTTTTTTLTSTTIETPTTTTTTLTSTTTTTFETTSTEITTVEKTPEIPTVHFILNTDTNCVHLNDTCNAARQILPENYVEIDIPENEIIYYKNEYWACGICAKKYKDQLPKFEDWQ